MSAWTNGTYTRKGLALLAKLTQGSSLRITRGVAGTGYVNPETLADQTAVTGVKQELAFKAASYPEAGTCKLPVFLTNEGLAAGYKARQIGLYANDPDNGEILYFIAQSENGTEVPGAAEMPDYSATWTFYFQYGQADSVSVTVDPSHTITEDMLNEVRAIAETGVSVAKAGALVRNDNAAALPLAGLRVFGKTTQDGTPTPEAPVELVSVENPTVVVAGKNLLNIGTATFEVTKLFMLDTPIPAGEYWLRCNIVSADTDGNYSTIVFQDNGTNVLYLPLKRGDVSQKITLKGLVDRVQLCAAYNNNEGVGDEATWSNLQLERSDKFTGYEAYKKTQTVVVSTPLNGLPGVPVPACGDYTDADGQQWACDEIDFGRGVYVQRCFRETVVPYYDELNDRYAATLTHKARVECGDGNGIPVICDKLSYNKEARSGINGVRISLYSPDFLLSYYNGENPGALEVVYPMAEPIETALTAEELASYAALVANNPVTTIFNDAGAWMEVDLVEAQHEKGIKMAIASQPVQSVEYPGCYYRMVDGEQEWLNPPMVADMEHRTTERWGGQPVYTQLFYIGQYVSGSVVTRNLGYPITVIQSDGVALSGHGQCMPFPSRNPDMPNVGIVTQQNNDIEFNMSESTYGVGYSTRVRLKYIKD